MPTRRDFLKHAAVAGSALSLGIRSPAPRKALRLLILGGTAFTGPHFVHRALRRGHAVSVFTRGRRDPGLFAEDFDHVERLVGDRADNLDALRGRTWDVVLDNSGRNADWTRASAALLKDSADLYVYTSSTGVFFPYLGDAMDESTRLVTEIPPERADDGEMGYGVMKATSEIAAREVFGDERTLIQRPTYIVGPGDLSNRFIYWPVRLERGGRVMVPGMAEDPIQFIDVRDFVDWSLLAMEDRLTGTFNLAGPASRLGMHAFVHGAHAAFSSAVDFVYIPSHEFMASQGIHDVVPWIMPVGDNYGSARIVSAKAQEAGLRFRPLAETVRDTIEWWRSDAVSADRRAGLIGEGSLMAREPEVIAAWEARG